MAKSRTKNKIDIEISTSATQRNGVNNNFMTTKNDKKILETALSNGEKNFSILLKKRGGIIDEKLHTRFSQEIASKVKVPLECTLTREGHVVIGEVHDVETAIKILKIKKLLGKEVICNLLIGTLSSKFVVCGIKPEISLKDLACELEKDRIRIIGAKRIINQNKGRLLPTHSVVITQIGHTIPDYVRIFNKNQRVRKYEEKPLFCKRCLSYGHREKFCTCNIVCNNCAEDHYYKECTVKTAKCKNCLENHPADSSDCISFEREVKILEIKNKLHISRKEAAHKLSIGEYRKIFGETSRVSEVAKGSCDVQDIITEMVKAKIDETFHEMYIDACKKIEEVMSTLEKKK